MYTAGRTRAEPGTIASQTDSTSRAVSAIEHLEVGHVGDDKSGRLI